MFTSKIRDERTVAAAVLIMIVVLPFIIFHWMIPFVSPLTLGNDYQLFAINPQMELLFSLKNGTYPLYVPGFACGQSAIALTLGQLFHPITFIVGHMPGYWAGKALELNTLFRILSLASVHFFLYFFLVKLLRQGLPAFILSTITVYNLQMLGLFVYAAPLETWTGFLFLCSAIGIYWLEPVGWVRPLFVIGAAYWLITSGHPHITYYCVLGTLFFIIIVPFFCAAISKEYERNSSAILKFWCTVSFYCGVGILLASAYIIPFYFDFLKHNVIRVKSGYEFTLTFPETFAGTINNFIHPLRSHAGEGFGGSSFYLAAALLPVLVLFRIHIPRVIWMIWGSALFVFLYMQGERTPIHYLAWKYFPFASALRIPERVCVVLPFLFMLILSWVISQSMTERTMTRKNIRLSPAMVLASASLLVILVFVMVPTSFYGAFSPFTAITIRKPPAWVEPVALFAGIASLFGLLLWGIRQENKINFLIFIWFAALIQITLLVQYGTWITPKQDKPTFKEVQLQRQKNLNYPHDPGCAMYADTVLKQIMHYSIEPFLGKVYEYFAFARDEAEVYKLMGQGRSPDQVIIKDAERFQIGTGCLKTNEVKQPLTNRTELIFNTFNRYIFKVQASSPTYFGCAFPFDEKHWTALVNGKETEIFAANGIAQAVEVPAGISEVEFRFWSDAVLGGRIISLIVLALVLTVTSFIVLDLPWNWLISVSAIVLIGTYFFVWYESLYSGTSIGTVYAWEAPDDKVPTNQAYSRSTYSSSIVNVCHWYNYNSGRAVDGNRQKQSGFFTKVERQPFWMIDFNENIMIDSVTIYHSSPYPDYNTCPMLLSTSTNGSDWRPAGIFTTRGMENTPIYLCFDEPFNARYLKIQGDGYCGLSFDEVEVYSPRE
ncbi:discoidin domain-containing protein [bacterium]|nr:discoidin domain-containing protein [bacterium]